MRYSDLGPIQQECFYSAIKADDTAWHEDHINRHRSADNALAIYVVHLQKGFTQKFLDALKDTAQINRNTFYIGRTEISISK